MILQDTSGMVRYHSVDSRSDPEVGHMKALTVSIVEAGKRLGVGRDASYNAAKRGDLPIIQIGGMRRVPLRALEKLLETGTLPTPAMPKEKKKTVVPRPRSARAAAGGRPKVCHTLEQCAAVPLHLPIQIELAGGRVTLTAVERTAARARGGEIQFAKVKLVALNARESDNGNNEAAGAT
jgi:excisionase family DNA binding protein